MEKIELNKLAQEAGMPPEDFVADLYACMVTYASMAMPKDKQKMIVEMTTPDEFNWTVTIERKK